MADYVHPEVLVSTEWVAAHGNDPGVRLVEVDVDTTAFDQGHIPGAIAWNWQTELQDALRRDLAEPKAFEELLGKAGVTADTTIVLYGDNNNWFAAWAFWQLKYYGHDKILLMNGGRKKWLEEKRPITTDKTAGPAPTYKKSAPKRRTKPPWPRPRIRPRLRTPLFAPNGKTSLRRSRRSLPRISSMCGRWMNLRAKSSRL